MRIGCWLGVCLAALTAAAAAPAAPAAPMALQPCWLAGVETRVLCGVLKRPLDPAAPQGAAIEIHVAVLPAVARNKKPDPVFFLAGGPGQSAIDLAGLVGPLLARLANRRDIVLIDQRGTGRSAPLKCDVEEEAARGLRDIDTSAQIALLQRCRERLARLPHGDLRRYTTAIAIQDAEAVRAALGAARVNLVGGSYGTRAALEYLRSYPAAVRRMVIDGVAPPDMALPASFSTDAQAAFDALLGWCRGDAGCVKRYPELDQRWRALLAALPRPAVLPDALTLKDEPVTLTREMVVGLVRLALYSPALAAALPLAIDEAAQGRWQPLVGLSGALGGGTHRQRLQLAQGMHFSVICAEDLPRVDQSADRPGADFGGAFADLYRRVCAEWPRGEVPAAFYTLPPADAPALVLSGGIDPVTPPRHGARVAAALGAKARHVVVAHAGHGVMVLPCMRDVVFRFIDADSDDDAARVDAACAQAIPRPPALQPLRKPNTPELAR